MPGDTNKERRPLRSFSNQLKAEVVGLVRWSGKPAVAIAWEFHRDCGARVGTLGRGQCRPSRRPHDRRAGGVGSAPQGESDPA
jgi:hypothetical protein